jgi:hypothetical protein
MPTDNPGPLTGYAKILRLSQQATEEYGEIADRATDIFDSKVKRDQINVFHFFQERVVSICKEEIRRAQEEPMAETTARRVPVTSPDGEIKGYKTVPIPMDESMARIANEFHELNGTLKEIRDIYAFGFLPLAKPEPGAEGEKS